MSAALPAVALIPMKRFADAKSRLAQHMPAAQRSAFARGMFERVLRAALGCPELSRTWVLTNGDDVAQAAHALGAGVLRDSLVASGDHPPHTLGALLDAALDALPALGARAVVVVMADLPRVESQDLTQLLTALEAHDLALIPDARGPCTNALAARLPLPFATAFGHPQSYAQHLARARALQLRACELHNPRVAHDVDTIADLPSELAATFTAPG